MPTDIHTSCESRQSKDYWYLDRSGRGNGTRLGLRALALVMAVSVMLAGASCGTGIEQTYGTDQPTVSRDSSSLLGSVVGGVVGTVTGVLKWFIDVDSCLADPALVPFKHALVDRQFSLNSTQRFDKVEFYYTDRTKENFSVDTCSFNMRVRYGKTLEGFMVRLKSDGSKWFFDGEKWFVDADSGRWYGDVDSATAPVATTY
jgi:hypothetical protein